MPSSQVISPLFGLVLAIAGLTIEWPAHAQQVTGTPGSPDATTTIDGRYLPPPP